MYNPGAPRGTSPQARIERLLPQRPVGHTTQSVAQYSGVNDPLPSLEGGFRGLDHLGFDALVHAVFDDRDVDPLRREPIRGIRRHR